MAYFSEKIKGSIYQINFKNCCPWLIFEDPKSFCKKTIPRFFDINDIEIHLVSVTCDYEEKDPKLYPVKLLNIIEKINGNKEREAKPENIIQICDFHHIRDGWGWEICKSLLPSRNGKINIAATLDEILRITCAYICVFVPHNVDREFFKEILDANLEIGMIMRTKPIEGGPMYLTPHQLDMVYSGGIRIEGNIILTD